MRRNASYDPITRAVSTAAGLVVLSILLIKTFSRSAKTQTKSTGPYRFSPRLSATLALAGFAADLLAIPTILRNKPLITRQSLRDLNLNQHSRLNAFALSRPYDLRHPNRKISDLLLRLSVASFLLVLLSNRMRRDVRWLFLLYAHTHALTYTFYTFSPLGPSFRNKYRPIVYYDGLNDERLIGNNRNSSYSGHTSSAAAASFFLAKAYSDYHPGTGKNIWLLAAIPPVAVGYYRVRALKHFPVDVLVAIFWGALFGIAIPNHYLICSPAALPARSSLPG